MLAAGNYAQFGAPSPTRRPCLCAAHVCVCLASDYGGRAVAGRSVKRICCSYDGDSTDIEWGDDNDPRNYRSGAVVAKGSATYNAERRFHRTCPPDEFWYEDQGPYALVVEGTQAAGNQICMFNRTVIASVLMASLKDYDDAFEADYSGINNKTAGIEYKEKDAQVWEQDKSDTSFFQLCAADRDIRLGCCEDPDDPTLDGKCTNGASEGTATECDETLYPSTTWAPDTSEFVFFKSVILNVVHRPPSPPPSPPPPSPPPPSPPPSKSRCTTRTRTYIHTR